MKTRVDDAALAAALERWARAPAAAPSAGERAAIDRIVAHGDDLASALPAPVPARRWWPLMTGAAVAAAVAALLLVPGPAGDRPPADPVADAPEASFALLYSPTLEEEILF